VAALVVGGVVTVAGMVTGNPVLTVIGVGVLFITSNATRVWYVRGRRRR
jgi:ABC-type glucose/galactose transport system permease subunit